jgi:aryl-alcohol dehydrogenase-like predicted oxidoreductase
MFSGGTVASKCGVAVFEDGEVTNSAAHIRKYIEGTIERLGFTPDLYYLHRMDPGSYTRRSNPPISMLPDLSV